LTAPKGSREVREPTDIKTCLSPCRRVIFAVLVLSIIICLVYSNSLVAGWQLDDVTNIVNNEGLHLEAASGESLKRTLFSDPGRPGGLYRPVACLTFALNYYLGGLDVLGYHLTNMTIHIVASIFLYLLIYHTLCLPSVSEKYGLQAYSIALLSTLLWAIHPIQVQSITYIVQRMTSLAGMFYVMSMYFYVKYRTAQRDLRKAPFMCLCSLAFLMSFGSKENALLLPLSVFLYEILLVQKSSVSFLRKNALKIVFVGTAVILAGLLFLYYREGGFFGFLRDYEGRPFSVTERLLTEPRVILFYLSLLIYPISDRFSIAHSFPISTSLIDPPSTLVSILAIAGALIFLFVLARKSALISFSFLFFFVNHLMESSVFGLELVFEHRNYVPSMFFFVPLSMGLIKGIDSSGKETMRYLLLVFTLLLILGFSLSAYSRNFAWINLRTLWTDALQKAPDQMRVHHNLGFSYQETGEWDKAIYQYEQALKSPVVNRKDEAFATLYQLGKVYSERGDRKKAISWYLKAIRMEPDFSPALVNLAVVYDKEGDRENADRYTLQAIEVDPGGGLTNLNIGIYLLRNGMAEAAIPHLEVAEKELSLRSRALLYLGIAYKQKHQYGRATVHLIKCIQLDQKNITPRLYLAEIYLTTDHVLKAREQAEWITNIITKDQKIYRQMMDLLSPEGESRKIQPNGEALRPLILAALVKKSENIAVLSVEVKKDIEKASKIK
jgi:Tfp pilus assembly protein PilF